MVYPSGRFKCSGHDRDFWYLTMASMMPEDRRSGQAGDARPMARNLGKFDINQSTFFSLEHISNK
jgi:hypothetical protein